MCDFCEKYEKYKEMKKRQNEPCSMILNACFLPGEDAFVYQINYCPICGRNLELKEVAND